MSPKRRRISASSLGYKNSRGGWLYFLYFSLLGVGVFLFLTVGKGFITGEYGREHQERIRELADKSGLGPEFYKRRMVTKKTKVFGESTLLIKANDYGQKYWAEEFTKIVAEAENKTVTALNIQDEINKPDIHNEARKKKVPLKDFPLIYSLFKEGKKLSKKSNFNISGGEMNQFWYNAFKKHQRLLKNMVSYQIFQREVETGKKHLSGQMLTKDDVKKNREKMGKITGSVIFKNRTVLPKMKDLKQFIPFADSGKIVLDEKEKTVQIMSPNISIDLSFFREAFFLEYLKEKLPSDMNYLIMIGNRYGMWKLDKKYVRWTISIDNPFRVSNEERGAIKLSEEEGFFSISRRLEKSMRFDEDIFNYFENWTSDKPEYQYELDRKYNKTLYDFPVDWRTGKSLEENLAALVVEPDIFKARMLSYSLLVSSKKEISDFETQFPEIRFLLLHEGSEKVFKKESGAWIEKKFSKSKIDSLLREDISRRWLDFIPKKKWGRDGDYYFLKEDIVYKPKSLKDIDFLSLDQIKQLRKEEKSPKKKENK